jgi:hypothetical protein
MRLSAGVPTMATTIESILRIHGPLNRTEIGRILCNPNRDSVTARLYQMRMARRVFEGDGIFYLPEQANAVIRALDSLDRWHKSYIEKKIARYSAEV